VRLQVCVVGIGWGVMGGWGGEMRGIGEEGEVGGRR
jgi:hypothetical protein